MALTPISPTRLMSIAWYYENMEPFHEKLTAHITNLVTKYFKVYTQ